MTDTQWLLDLVEETRNRPKALAWSSTGPRTAEEKATAKYEAAKDVLIALAPDLARLVVEQHEALANIVNGEEFDVDLEPARAALARFAAESTLKSSIGAVGR